MKMRTRKRGPGFFRFHHLPLCSKIVIIIFEFELYKAMDGEQQSIISILLFWTGSGQKQTGWWRRGHFSLLGWFVHAITSVISSHLLFLSLFPLKGWSFFWKSGLFLFPRALSFRQAWSWSLELKPKSLYHFLVYAIASLYDFSAVSEENKE